MRTTDTGRALFHDGRIIPHRHLLADAAALRELTDPALRGRTVLREILPGLGPLTR